MEEKNLNEAQVAEQTTSQDENTNKVESELDVILNENATLKAENEQLQKELADSRVWASRNYVQAQIMRKTIDALKAKHDITDGDMYVIMMEANNITMDDLLLRLSR